MMDLEVYMEVKLRVLRMACTASLESVPKGLSCVGDFITPELIKAAIAETFGEVIDEDLALADSDEREKIIDALYESFVETEEIHKQVQTFADEISKGIFGGRWR